MPVINMQKIFQIKVVVDKWGRDRGYALDLMQSGRFLINLLA